MGKKGLSIDEKRQKMLDYFFEKKEVFTLKELESILPRLKGITSQSIKEVLQSLVDDNLVSSDKIGSSTFYWALPSQSSHQISTQITNIQNNIKVLEDNKEQFLKQKRNLLHGREDTEERTNKIQILDEKKNQNNLLDQELDKYCDCDPARMEQLKKSQNIFKESISRWTDSIFILISEIKKINPEMKEEMILSHFGLPLDLDYIE